MGAAGSKDIEDYWHHSIYIAADEELIEIWIVVSFIKGGKDQTKVVYLSEKKEENREWNLITKPIENF